MTKVFWFAYAAVGCIACLCTIATCISILFTILDTIIRRFLGYEFGIWKSAVNYVDDYVDLIFKPLGFTFITIVLDIVLFGIYNLVSGALF